MNQTARPTAKDPRTAPGTLVHLPDLRLPRTPDEWQEARSKTSEFWEIASRFQSDLDGKTLAAIQFIYNFFCVENDPLGLGGKRIGERSSPPSKAESNKIGEKIRTIFRWHRNYAPTGRAAIVDSSISFLQYFWKVDIPSLRPEDEVTKNQQAHETITPKGKLRNSYVAPSRADKKGILVYMNPSHVEALKIVSQANGKTLQEYISGVLQQHLEEQKSPERMRKITEEAARRAANLVAAMNALA